LCVLLESNQPIIIEISNHQRIERNNERIIENRDNIFRKKSKAKGKNLIFETITAPRRRWTIKIIEILF